MTGREQGLMTLTRLGFGEAEACDMVRWAKSLHTIYEAQCNGFRDDAEEARVKRREVTLRAKIEALAAANSYKVYHQTDPRGRPVTLYRTGDLTAYQKRSKYDADATISSCYNAIGRAII